MILSTDRLDLCFFFNIFLLLISLLVSGLKVKSLHFSFFLKFFFVFSLIMSFSLFFSLYLSLDLDCSLYFCSWYSEIDIVLWHFQNNSKYGFGSPSSLLVHVIETGTLSFLLCSIFGWLINNVRLSSNGLGGFFSLGYFAGLDFEGAILTDGAFLGLGFDFLAVSINLLTYIY